MRSSSPARTVAVTSMPKNTMAAPLLVSMACRLALLIWLIALMDARFSWLTWLAALCLFCSAMNAVLSGGRTWNTTVTRLRSQSESGPSRCARVELVTLDLGGSHISHVRLTPESCR